MPALTPERYEILIIGPWAETVSPATPRDTPINIPHPEPNRWR